MKLNGTFMNKQFFFGLLVGLGLLLIVAFRPAGQKPVLGVQQWEYQKIGCSPDKMNEAGQKGWELVAIEGSMAYFKRLVQ